MKGILADDFGHGAEVKLPIAMELRHFILGFCRGMDGAAFFRTLHGLINELTDVLNGAVAPAEPFTESGHLRRLIMARCAGLDPLQLRYAISGAIQEMREILEGTDLIAPLPRLEPWNYDTQLGGNLGRNYARV